MRYIVSLFVCYMFSWATTPAPEENPFPTPETLKDNVTFWKKIYAETSLKEGLIHDSEYPLVIYKKIVIGEKRGRQRRQFLRNHINAIKILLKNINTKPEAKWSAEEKRIATLFENHSSLEKLKTAKNRIRFQQGQRERFTAGIERSGAYLPFIRSVLMQYQIPEKIVFLPHVESSFNPKAYSKVGAAGMWQFMRRTGRLFLRVDYSVDERWDPYKSTTAAAKLLKKNYEELKSWPLAITAYNHGPESIKNAVKVTGSRDIGVIISKYKNRRFRFASKNFYSCFLAVSEIAANPGSYFSNLDYHRPIKFNEITLESYITPTTLSKYLGVSQEVLASLNPALRPVIFRRQFSVPKGYALRIPGSISTQTAAEKIAKIPGSLKREKSDIYRYYSVRKGDSLYRIARRFRVSTNALLQANKVGPNGRIYVGQVLKIPGKTPTSSSKPTVALKIIKQKKTDTPGSPEEKTVHKTGESLAREIQKAKKLPDLTKETGQGESYPETFDATLYNLNIKLYHGKGTARITVTVDETLGHYADWLAVPTMRIRRMNRLGRRNIRINQRLILPLREDSVEQFKNKRLEYHMSLEEDFYNNYQVVGVKSRKVKYGENLWAICSEEDIPLWLFKKFNRAINIEKIRVNTKIQLPVIKEKRTLPGENRQACQNLLKQFLLVNFKMILVNGGSNG